MKSKLLQNIILLIITIILFIFLLEAATRIYVYLKPQSICDTYSSQDDYFLCRLQFNLSKGLDNQNRPVFKLQSEVCDIWDAQLGWVPSPNCTSVKNHVKYSTNSEGFRGSKEFKLEKNRTRIIIVGDSFTWGEGNQNDETYPYLLDILLNQSADVINMGVRGYGPDQFYIHLMRDGLKYKPDIVVFGLYLPDIHRTHLRVYSFFKPRFAIQNNTLRLDPSSSIPDLRSALEMSVAFKDKKHFYSLSYLYGLYTKFVRLATSYKDEESLTFSIIKFMDKQLKKNDIRMVVLLIPEQGMVENGQTSYHGVMPKIIQDMEGNGIDYVNLQPIFVRETNLYGKSLYNGHTNLLGNKIIADELYNYLNENKLIKTK